MTQVRFKIFFLNLRPPANLDVNELPVVFFLYIVYLQQKVRTRQYRKMEHEKVKEALDGLGTQGIWACTAEKGDGFNQRPSKEQKDIKRDCVRRRGLYGGR